MTRKEAIEKYGNPVENHQLAMTETANLMEAIHRSIYTEILAWLAGPTENAQQVIAIILEKRAAYGLSNDPVPELQAQHDALPTQAELDAATDNTNVQIHGEVDDKNLEAVLGVIRLALGGKGKHPKGRPIIIPLDPETPLN